MMKPWSIFHWLSGSPPGSASIILARALPLVLAHNIGEISLGTFLVVGFIIQNITEGLGIIAPLLRDRPSLRALALLGLVGGGPAILGVWIGGYAPSPTLAVLFLSIGAGAIFQVVYEIAKLIQKDTSKQPRPGCVFSGVLTGMLMLWVTGLLIKIGVTCQKFSPSPFKTISNIFTSSTRKATLPARMILQTALTLRLHPSQGCCRGRLRRNRRLSFIKNIRASTLTKAGEKAAVEVIRHHRLLELYLVKALGYSWDQVHHEADKLEHVISEDFELRYSRGFGKPNTRPSR